MLGCFLLVHGLLLYVLQGIFREQKGYTCIYSFFFATLDGLWDLSSPPGIKLTTPCSGSLKS